MMMKAEATSCEFVHVAFKLLNTFTLNFLARLSILNIEKFSTTIFN